MSHLAVGLRNRRHGRSRVTSQLYPQTLHLLGVTSSEGTFRTERRRGGVCWRSRALSARLLRRRRLLCGRRFLRRRLLRDCRFRGDGFFAGFLAVAFAVATFFGAAFFAVFFVAVFGRGLGRGLRLGSCSQIAMMGVTVGGGATSAGGDATSVGREAAVSAGGVCATSSAELRCAIAGGGASAIAGGGITAAGGCASGAGVSFAAIFGGSSLAAKCMPRTAPTMAVAANADAMSHWRRLRERGA